ncbi:hypothetical protein JQX13_31640 [Archangium violaceum]|uniref:hypothetical protein n=1 Tax=Archangium violaceum TaxID=83451 RepID=UPI00193BF094|nr:hypothetical protein [Archangium violaceum]QRK04762.1 hypothetical protein JQX13_31640 [Archangium violaceum]
MTMPRIMRKQARRFVLAAGLLVVPALSMAADQGAKGQQARSAGQKSPAAATQASPMNVEQLNDNIAQHSGKQVSVAGEIEEWLDARSFVLESGGLFNDEIAVIVPPNAKGVDAQRLREDADIVVSGTVRSVPLVELERELGWDLDPELEVEFEGTKHFLVADRITRQRD